MAGLSRCGTPLFVFLVGGVVVLELLVQFLLGFAVGWCAVSGVVAAVDLVHEVVFRRSR